MTLSRALHDGSPWLLLVCAALVAGVAVGLYTRRWSGISSHPYINPYSGGELASDLPQESIGRADIEPLLRGHPWAGRRAESPRMRARRAGIPRAPLLAVVVAGLAMSLIAVTVILPTDSWWAVAGAFAVVLVVVALVIVEVLASMRDGRDELERDEQR